MEKFGSRLLTLTLVFLLASEGVVLGDSSAVRTDHPFGLIVGLDGSPAPSGMGFQLGVNALQFLRLEGGGGFYNEWLGPNIPIGAFNYSLRPLLYGMVWVLAAVFETAFYYPFSHHYAFLDYSTFASVDYLHGKSSTTFGYGAELLVPGWRLSPALGLHWAHYDVSGGAYGLEGSGDHTYYSMGLDYQSATGFNVGVGYNICAQAPRACGPYVNLGAFF